MKELEIFRLEKGNLQRDWILSFWPQKAEIAHRSIEAQGQENLPNNQKLSESGMVYLGSVKVFEQGLWVTTYEDVVLENFFQYELDQMASGVTSNCDHL